MKAPEFSVAKEGLPFILFAGFAALICAVLQYRYAALAGLAVTAFVTYFFRDPERTLPEDSGAMVSPADGKVIRMEELHDDRFLHQDVLRISIFMNVFNVHVNRIPLAGTVRRIVFEPGRFYAADQDKAALHNEYCAVIVETAAGQQYAAVQIAGLIARRIVCRAELGDQVITGQRYGLIRFGSRVDLYLPKGSETLVQVGETVKAGETVLARVKEK
ncbi:phosphatidylserine decarboxylase family protein [Candidatus Electronema sp. PJ]|uniref:phosphatidylserine decarboxylase family protein n=1 Tax=Candidatus Electronema sp. PJ TaxID=3401572 RepID=UPI003AA9D99B